MCGRFSFAPDLKIVNEHYGITINEGDYKPNYNCAPSQILPVICGENPEKLSYFIWGSIPLWAKDKSIGNRIINARGETITKKESFKNSFRRKRCLIPADAFYEWKSVKQKKRRTPFRIFLKDSPLFSMAGIWDQWQSYDGSLIKVFYIITTTPNELISQIHNRMPVILKKEHEKIWLNKNKEDVLLGLLKPYPSQEMDAYEISELVNYTSNNSPEITKPAT